MTEHEGRCGGCAAFTRARTDPAKGRVGECALNVFPPPISARSTCSRYRPRGGEAPPPPQRAAGQPRSQRAPRARREAPRRPPEKPLPQEIDMDIGDFRRVLREVLSEELGLGEAELGGRWEGGEIILKPGKAGTSERRIPLDAFFHKIVMVRDKLRLMEQKINSHPGLSDADKVQLQSYVTACYGSLTTFNALFADREDWFVGAGKDSDEG